MRKVDVKLKLRARASLAPVEVKLRERGQRLRLDAAGGTRRQLEASGHVAARRCSIRAVLDDAGWV